MTLPGAAIEPSLLRSAVAVPTDYITHGLGRKFHFMKFRAMRSSDISELLQTPVQVTDSNPLSGGCISEVRVLNLDVLDPSAVPTLTGGGRDSRAAGQSLVRLVVKRNSAEMVSNFSAEAAGLMALSATNTIGVPRVIAHRLINNQAYLAMQWIDSAKTPPVSADYEQFGRRLAKMHQASQGDEHGWSDDNFLGAAPQKNEPAENWSEFFADRRIGFQIRWAVDQGLADRNLIDNCHAIINRMPDLLDGRDQSHSLLHGDLWSGNYLFDQDRQPVLIDPAVYRGCREAEWGMIVWFGGCPPAFESGYQHQWPMPAGWKRRVEIYKLYHQLNHLNLFGSSYAGVCQQTSREILR